MNQEQENTINTIKAFLKDNLIVVNRPFGTCIAIKGSFEPYEQNEQHIDATIHNLAIDFDKFMVNRGWKE